VLRETRSVSTGLRMLTTISPVRVSVLPSCVPGDPVDDRKLRKTVTQVPGSKCHHRSWLHKCAVHFAVHRGTLARNELDARETPRGCFS
jgi:hypothetical protein